MKTVDKLQKAKKSISNNQFLIDTHILLWTVAEPNKLSLKSVEIIKNNKNDIFVSLISFWEIAIKSSIGKLKFKTTISELEKITISKNIKVLNLNTESIEIVRTLPFYKKENEKHRDPFDRIIISQAIKNDLPILSADTKFDLYTQITRIW